MKYVKWFVIAYCAIFGAFAAADVSMVLLGYSQLSKHGNWYDSPIFHYNVSWEANLLMGMLTFIAFFSVFVLLILDSKK